MAKIAIVTGVSRKKGIGYAVCRELAARGFDIFFTYWTAYDRLFPWGVGQEEPLEIREEIASLGVRCASLELDLSDAAAPTRLFDAVEQELGAPSVLINNATHSEGDGFEHLTAEGLDKHYAINVRATTLLSVEFARRFEQGTGGRIVNLTSGPSLGPMIDELAYAITKGAVEMLTKQLYAAVAHKGITVNAVNPGPTDTGWMDDELRQAILPRFPLGRVGMPADAARLIGFLVSEEGEWVTGQVIHSEGGFQR